MQKKEYLNIDLYKVWVNIFSCLIGIFILFLMLLTKPSLLIGSIFLIFGLYFVWAFKKNVDELRRFK